MGERNKRMDRAVPLTGPVPGEARRQEVPGDEPLMEAVREGDERAFEMLMTRYKTPITNYVGSIIRERDRARDLTQEVFLRVYRAAGRYRPGGFSTWLYTIATNLAREELRRRRRWAGRLFPLETPDDRTAPAGQGDADASGAQLLRDETTRRVRGALHGLPPKYRIAVVLRDIQGLSYEEITGVMRLPLSTVKTRIHRGRLLLKERLRPYVEEMV
jgi:RNA polymerase sigma-70 factor (ECF subfamily)